jgi:prepilin-type N-terminal cleavage/methylation domain-containing protein
MSRRSGFTLLEILLALALVGMILVALNTFIFSMGELWGRNSEVRLFNQHVNAVTRFVGDTLQTAAFPPSARANSVPVAPVQVTPQSGVADNLISFYLPAGCRLLNWADRPLPEVNCSLQARPNDGLYLLWQSDLELNFGTFPPRETLITPLVTALKYDYYDPVGKTWTTVTTLNLDPNNQPLVPERLRLCFSYGKLYRETTVVVPEALQGLGGTGTPIPEVQQGVPYTF